MVSINRIVVQRDSAAVEITEPAAEEDCDEHVNGVRITDCSSEDRTEANHDGCKEKKLSTLDEGLSL